MRPIRSALALATLVMLASLVMLSSSTAQSVENRADEVLRSWYKVALELVRHTPTYSPPVASRSFAYLGVVAFEATASGQSGLKSLAGQLNGLQDLPARETGETYDEAVVLEAAMANMIATLFRNTGPAGQRVIPTFKAKLDARAAAGLPEDVVLRSTEYGASIAAHMMKWSQSDGGAHVEYMGFPQNYTLKDGAEFWRPTSLIALQQTPLLPGWGKNRTFAMPDSASCQLPAPPQYSEDKNSQFYKEALEVVETQKNLTPEQRAIAKFWSDDPMLSPTPPGHWISIALQIIERDNVSLDRSADVLARLGITLADAFIGCWHTKFEYDLLRPVTYIRRTMDPKWESLLITPPFPEYPSGHSTQSGAAAEVLTQAFGEDFAFEDATHHRDGLAHRSFASFHAAAQEAALSRLYGGIHFKAAVQRGLEQGRCIGAFTNRLQTKR